MSEGNYLDPPAPVLVDAKATEVLRVWAGTDRLLLTLRTSWSDPAAWGIVLADIARHVANAYESEGYGRAEQVEARVRQAFLAEWEEQTSEVERLRSS
jgi:hypothetical protein